MRNISIFCHKVGLAKRKAPSSMRKMCGFTSGHLLSSKYSVMSNDSVCRERKHSAVWSVCSICACLVLSVSSSSWCLGRAAVCDYGTPWTFHLPFFAVRACPEVIFVLGASQKILYSHFVPCKCVPGLVFSLQHVNTTSSLHIQHIRYRCLWLSHFLDICVLCWSMLSKKRMHTLYWRESSISSVKKVHFLLLWFISS